MLIIIGCLRSTSTDHLTILSGIQPAKFCRLGATLCLANRVTLDPDHILHGELHRSIDVPQERLKSRRPFATASRKISNDLSKLGIRAAQWTNYRWSAEYSKRTSVLHVFIPRTSFRLFEMGLVRTSWVNLNRLRTGVGHFHLPMYKWSLAPSPNCECGATDHTANHLISTSSIHRAPQRVAGLTVLDDNADAMA